MKIVEVRWSSSDGRVEFSPVYEDGTVGPVVRTNIETNQTNRFRTEKARIERELIGKEEK